MHKDIRLEKIKITDHGTLKLIGFGMSKFIGDEIDLRSLKQPLYLAPEVIQSSLYYT